MKKAFTLIELLVVIAIIAILGRDPLPGPQPSRVSAKQTKSLSQMRQLAASVMMYASDHDDNMVPASNRRSPRLATRSFGRKGSSPISRTVKFSSAPDSGGGVTTNWATRRHQSVGYSDATGFDGDPAFAATPGSAPPGTEGFGSVANFSEAEESARVGLFAVTAKCAARQYVHKTPWLRLQSLQRPELTRRRLPKGLAANFGPRPRHQNR